MKIKITTKQLKKLGACQSGLDDFERVTGGIYEAEWTLEEQLKLLKTDLRKWYSWAVKVNIVPMWGMVGVDLSNTDLSNADLAGINLSDANLAYTKLGLSKLCNAYLLRTNFRFAESFIVDFHDSYLVKADFFGADLSCCSFIHAILVGANFNQSNLYRANISYANLIDVDFSTANLYEANLEGSIVNEFTKFPEGFDYKRLEKRQ